MPFTCFLLDEQLEPLLERYWSANLTENLQIPAECERFAAFLDTEIHAGRVAGRYLEEVLAFERACAELRFLTAEELRQRASPYSGPSALVRIVTFRHNPEALLGALKLLEAPPPNIETGEYYLLIDCRSEEPDFRLLTPMASPPYSNSNRSEVRCVRALTCCHAALLSKGEKLRKKLR